VAESGGLSGLFTTDGEAPAEGTSPETPTPLDPTAAALAAEAAKNNPELAKNASAYFLKQNRLVEIQTEHLHEQRALSLQLLKLKRIDERLRVALRLFVILVATVVGFGASLIRSRPGVTRSHVRAMRNRHLPSTKRRSSTPPIGKNSSKPKSRSRRIRANSASAKRPLPTDGIGSKPVAGI